jgi:lactate dehydrogenase-like 2-hydroxyacid dehydrogenase
MLFIVYPDARFTDDGVIERSMLMGRSDVELCIFHERPDGISAVPIETFARCDALVVYHKLKVDDLLLDRAPRCRLVVRAGVGLNNIDLKACAARGVPVCNVPHYGTHEVADHTISLMLTLVRGTLAYNERLRADPLKGWQFEGVAPVRRIFGSVLGIAGLGRIGTAVAERGVGFGMKIVYFGGKQHAEFDRVHSMEELLGRSDVLSLHLPLTEDTQGLIDASAISMMKRGLILINTARGPLIDTAAVCEGLRNGRLAAVGLDVLPTEPPDLTDPLISAWKAGEEWIRDKLVITPHAAFFSHAGFSDLRRSSMRTALSFLCDGELHSCVNERELKLLPARDIFLKKSSHYC